MKKLQKRHPAEIDELFGRLRSFVEMLNSGLSIPQARARGWVHDKYKHGMLSLDAGGGKGRAKLRLYILPDDGRIMVFVAGVGTKDTQCKDVGKAYDLIERHRKPRSGGES